MNPKFCPQCGAPVEPGARFCTQCGREVGAPPAAAPVPVADPAANPASGLPAPPPPVAPKPGRPRRQWLLVVIGLLLLFVALRPALVAVAGRTATGEVVNVTQNVQSADRMDYVFEVAYRFRDAAGKEHRGSYTLTKVYNQALLPAEGAAVPVRYLAFAPWINARVGGSTPLQSLGLGVLGLFLVIAGWKSWLRLQSRRR